MIKTIISTTTIILLLTACISGAPDLTDQQQVKQGNIIVLRQGEILSREYKVISQVSAADCSGAPYGGRVWGEAEKAIETLKAKAAFINADAIINVSCSAVPMLNNCWAAKKCSGEAISFQ